MQSLISKAEQELTAVRFTEGAVAHSHALEAVEIMRKAVSIDKKDSNAWEFLCRALLCIDKMEEAKVAWKKARSLEKDDIFSFTAFNMIIANDYPIMLEEMGEMQYAELVRKSFTAASPEIPELWLALSNFYGRVGKREQQILTLTKAARLSSDENIHIWLIELLLEVQAFKAADDAADKAIQKFPETPWPLSMKGWVYVQEGQPEKAIGFFQKAMKIDPDDFEAPYRFAMALQYLKRFEEAKSLVREVIEKHPENANGWNLLGSISLDQRNLDECETAFRKAVELEPQSPDLIGNLIVALKEQGKNQEIDILKKKIEELT